MVRKTACRCSCEAPIPSGLGAANLSPALVGPRLMDPGLRTLRSTVSGGPPDDELLLDLFVIDDEHDPAKLGTFGSLFLTYALLKLISGILLRSTPNVSCPAVNYVLLDAVPLPLRSLTKDVDFPLSFSWEGLEDRSDPAWLSSELLLFGLRPTRAFSPSGVAPA